MSPPPRVVLDTNIVLSALVFPGGRLASLRLAWRQARLHPLVSRATVSELARVLAYPKFGLSAAERDELLSDYLPYCSVVRDPRSRPPVPACRDPFDVPFLELAIAGKADYLVSGDKDLLALSGKLRCPIVTADRLLERLA